MRIWLLVLSLWAGIGFANLLVEAGGDALLSNRVKYPFVLPSITLDWPERSGNSFCIRQTADHAKQAEQPGSSSSFEEPSKLPTFNPSSDKEAHNIRFIKDLDKQFRLLLRSLSHVLNRHSETNFLLVTDIDRTLVHHFSDFSVEAQEVLGTDGLRLLQQSYFYHLNAFIHQHPNLLLVYNTARPSLPFRFIDIATLNWEDSTLSSLKPRKRMLSLDVDHPGERYTYGIPVPDAIISGGGMHIALHPKHTSRMSSPLRDQVEGINETLASWVKKDFMAVSQNLNTLLHTQGIENWPEFNFHRSFLFLRHYNPGGRLPWRLFTQHGPLGKRYDFILKTRINKLEQIDNMLVSDTCVNKGTSLRLLTKIMSQGGLFKQRITYMISMGDSLPDLPAIRPDKEAEALGELSLYAQQLKASRLHEQLGPVYHHPHHVSWLCSVLFNAKSFQEIGNEYIELILKHPRVLKVDSQKHGFLDGLELMLNYISHL